jgi:hypothetical protein
VRCRARPRATGCAERHLLPDSSADWDGPPAAVIESVRTRLGIGFEREGRAPAPGSAESAARLANDSGGAVTSVECLYNHGRMVWHFILEAPRGRRRRARRRYGRQRDCSTTCPDTESYVSHSGAMRRAHSRWRDCAVLRATATRSWWRAAVFRRFVLGRARHPNRSSARVGTAANCKSAS